MKELIIKGTDEYIDYMKNFLKKEHPNIKNKLSIKKLNPKENLLIGDDSDLNDLLGVE